ncbi:hypothetical protein [Neisseria shayeganii]|uniref:Uncharacterized protein n=1 Tax=Neisseria shayeganii TaxID=607712 RepID=A0A7D7N6G6_9NEIS|nr:hypothetical protein [Neisseria shayeganii]QMT41280.1 hypothetical protein H3L94_04435 [Neisseria shayeganii]
MVTLYRRVDIDVELDDSDIQEILEKVGCTCGASAGTATVGRQEIAHLIDQADLETHQMTLPPYLRELLEHLTGRRFGQ